MSTWLRNQRTEWRSNKLDHKILELLSALIEQERLKKSTQSDQHNLDFTEKLWDILKECQSGETLTRALQIIFDKLCSGDFSAMVSFFDVFIDA